MMATQPEADEPEDDILELGEEPEQDVPETPDESEEETVIELEGDDETPEPESAPIRQLREQLKEEKRKRAELEQRTAPKPVELGPEPVWDDNEDAWDWDGKKFAAAYEAWLNRAREAERQQADQSRAQDQQRAEAERLRANYQANAAKLQAQARLAPEAYKASEDAVVAALPEVVQSIMIKYMPDQAPMLTHILGTRPKKLEEIAAITDPLAQAFALYDLAKGIKVVTKRKAPPAPEERVSGSGPISSGARDKELERLEKAAERTGDRSALIKYRASMRSK